MPYQQRQERFNLASMTADEIRRKVLDPYQSNLNLIAADHPEVIEQLAQQYENDKTIYGKIPVFISITSNSGLINTTIRYRDLIRFLPLFQQRPDLVGTVLGNNLAKRTEIPLTQESYRASDLYGLPDMPQRR